jgi:RsbT co-antagonist protein rsbRD N-terminal domain
MSLADLLKLKRPAILGQWRRMILETYPADGASFMQREKDRFHNPVGHTIGEATDALFDAVVAGRSGVEISSALDGIIRVRAVQEFSAAQAVAFAFQLKRAIREELGDALSTRESWTELSRVEAAIDDMALTAFDLYMRCRESVYEIRAREVKRQTSRLIEIMGRDSMPAEDGVQTAGGNDEFKSDC